MLLWKTSITKWCRLIFCRRKDDHLEITICTSLWELLQITLEPGSHVQCTCSLHVQCTLLQYIDIFRKKLVEYTRTPSLHKMTTLQRILNSGSACFYNLLSTLELGLKMMELLKSLDMYKEMDPVEDSHYQQFTLLPLRTPALIMAWYFNGSSSGIQ